MTTKTDHGDHASAGRVSALLATPPRPGAVAIIQLCGDVTPLLRQLTGHDDWPVGLMRHMDLADIDDAVVILLETGLETGLDTGIAQLMPHGGMRVVQRLMMHLRELGVEIIDAATASPQTLFPEATSPVEAAMLATLGRAASPLAIDLLLDQPRRWQGQFTPTAEDVARSQRLDRLVTPPTVVLAGPPNVGKSTLTNALLGRAISVAADQPGTTRDYTAGHLDLAGVVVRWHDTPGLRDSDDPIEQRAIALSRTLMEQADLLIAITDHEQDWPRLPRVADLRVAAKSDLGRPASTGSVPHPIVISALTGNGLAELVIAIRDTLVPPKDLAHKGPWAFHETLRH